MKELKIKGALGKDYQQIYIGDEPTGIQINNEGKVRIKDLVVKQTASLINEGMRIGAETIDIAGTPTFYEHVINTDGQLVLKADTGVHFEYDSGAISFRETGAISEVSIDGGAGTIWLFPEGSALPTDYTTLGIDENGGFTITSVDAAGTDAAFTVDVDGAITLDSHTGNFIAKTAGTEFSAANSAYAGMMLGYTQVGADATAVTVNLTTSFVSHGTFAVTFKTPPSENVEIQVIFWYENGSAGRQVFSAIANHQTYASGTLVHPDQFEKKAAVAVRYGGGTAVVSHILQSGNLNAVGVANTIYAHFKCDSTSGTPLIRYGGDAADEYQNLVIKAIALPA